MWKIGIWVENFMSAAILVLQWQGENFFQVEEFEICPISNCTLFQKKGYITKGIQPISQNFPAAQRCGK